MPPLARTAWLEIDLDAIAANLGAIRRAVERMSGPSVRVEPVVKADAYGHGLVPVALALERDGADGLGVATLDEALELRAARVSLPLLVLYPVPRELATIAAEQSITVTVGDADAAAELLEALRRRPADRPLRVQLEVETGLGRGGVAAADAAALATLLGAAPEVELVGIWSHLQAPADAALTGRQVDRFEAATSNAATPRHLSASGGLLAGAPVYEAVRPGLAIYGIDPDDLLDPEGRQTVGLDLELRPAMSLRARPVRVAELPAGWGVSYGPSWRTERPSRIATLPLGYGDGWPREASNRADALVRGRRVPLVGTVAMDAVMADVTDIPGPPVTTDDVFTLLGADERSPAAPIGVHELARARNTIAWEVTTSMSARLGRVYYRAAVPVGLRTLSALALAGPRETWPGSSSGTATSASWRSTRS
ncbi:MAG TPA: alanine racemase [Candidatus Limnocylindrales bacterium]|nr:alanine racemase [Candidatus Limnocylindrales bacterium]